MTTVLRYTPVDSQWFYALAPYKTCEGVFAIVFPLFLFNTLHLSISTVGALTGLISLGAVAGSMFWGHISDYYRIRRAFIVLGCVLGGVCLAGIGWLTHLVGLGLLCFGFGFFSIATAPIASVLIMETMAESQWDAAFGRFNAIGGWGWIAGLATGAVALPVLQIWTPLAQSLRLTLWGLAAIMIAMAWWAARTIPAPRRRVTRRQFINVTRRLPRLPVVERVLYLPRRLLFVLHPCQLLQLPSVAFSRYLAATGLMFISFIIVLTPLPLYLQNVHHMDHSLIFLLTLARALASAPFYTLAGRWMSRFGARRVQVWAALGRCLAFGALAVLVWAPGHLILMGALVAINAMVGLTWSGFAVAGPALVGRLTPQKRQGEAMGLYNAVQGAGQIVGALLGGYLAHAIGYHTTFLLGALLLLPAIALLNRVKPQTHAGPMEPPLLSRKAA